MLITKEGFRALLLVLLLAIGPVHAEALFVCAEMEAMSDNPHCDNEMACMDSGCADMMNASDEPCCQKTLELRSVSSVENDAKVIRLPHIQSDVDPPLVWLAFDTTYPIPTYSIIVPIGSTGNHPYQSGALTYRTTQRLRI